MGSSSINSTVRFFSRVGLLCGTSQNNLQVLKANMSSQEYLTCVIVIYCIVTL